MFFPLLRVARDSGAPSGQNVQRSTLNLEYWTLLGWPCECWSKKSESTPPVSSSHTYLRCDAHSASAAIVAETHPSKCAAASKSLSGAGSVQGARLSSVGYSTGTMSLPLSLKQLTLNHNNEIAANSTAVLRHTLTVRRKHDVQIQTYSYRGRRVGRLRSADVLCLFVSLVA